ncbi:flagellar hook-length control protein FliK [candidate division KSB1 bacterium]
MNNSLFLVSGLFDIISLQGNNSIPKPENINGGLFKELFYSYLNKNGIDLNSSSLKKFDLTALSDEKDGNKLLNIFHDENNLKPLIIDNPALKSVFQELSELSGINDELINELKISGKLNFEDFRFVENINDEKGILIVPLTLDDSNSNIKENEIITAKFAVPIDNVKTKENYFQELVFKDNSSKSEEIDIPLHKINLYENKSFINGEAEISGITVFNDFEMNIPVSTGSNDFEKFDVKLNLIQLLSHLIEKVTGSLSKLDGIIDKDDDLYSQVEKLLKQNISNDGQLFTVENKPGSMENLLKSLISEIISGKDSEVYNIDKNDSLQKTLENEIEIVLGKPLDVPVKAIVPGENEGITYSGILKIEPDQMENILAVMFDKSIFMINKDIEKVPEKIEKGEFAEDIDINIEHAIWSDSKKADNDGNNRILPAGIDYDLAENSKAEIFLEKDAIGAFSVELKLEDVSGKENILIPVINRDNNAEVYLNVKPDELLTSDIEKLISEKRASGELITVDSEIILPVNDNKNISDPEIKLSTEKNDKKQFGIQSGSQISGVEKPLDSNLKGLRPEINVGSNFDKNTIIPVKLEIEPFDFELSPEKGLDNGVVRIEGKFELPENEEKTIQLLKFYKVGEPETTSENDNKKIFETGQLTIKSDIGDIKLEIPLENLKTLNPDLVYVPEKGDLIIPEKVNISDMVDMKNIDKTGLIFSENENLNIKQTNYDTNLANYIDTDISSIELVEKLKTDFPELNVKSIDYSVNKEIESVKIEFMPVEIDNGQGRRKVDISLLADMDKNFKISDKGTLLISSYNNSEVQSELKPDALDEKIKSFDTSTSSGTSEKGLKLEPESDIDLNKIPINKQSDRNEKLDIKYETEKIEIPLKRNTLFTEIENNIKVYEFKISKQADGGSENITDLHLSSNKSADIENVLKLFSENSDTEKEVVLQIGKNGKNENPVSEPAVSLNDIDLSKLKLTHSEQKEIENSTVIKAQIYTENTEKESVKLEGYLIVDKAVEKKIGLNDPAVEKLESVNMKNSSGKVFSLFDTENKYSGQANDFSQKEGSKEQKDLKNDNVTFAGEKVNTSSFDKEMETAKPRNFDFDYSRTIEGIVKQVKLQLDKGVNEITIDLEPKFLGKMKMKIRMEENHLNAKVNVETAEVKRIIESNLDRLKDSLRESGVEIEKFDINVKKEASREFFNEGFNTHQHTKNGYNNRNFNDIKPENPVEVINRIRQFGYNSMEITI